MKKTFIALTLLILGQLAFAGDTLRVQTFTFGSAQDSTFLFPSDTIRFEKILMNYKLRCNPTGNPLCGEWDYLTYTYLYDDTGVLDSTLYQAPSYVVNGSSPDSLPYNTTPSWTSSATFQSHLVIDASTSMNTVTIPSVSPSNQSNAPFGSAMPQSRTQYLWTASEMTGLSAGAITGLRFNILSTGSMLRKLRIRIKNSSLTSLSNNTFDSSGLTEVYLQNTSFLSSGWQTLNFTNNFVWDGSSNVLVDIAYENAADGTDTQINAQNISDMGLRSADHDRSVFINDNDYVALPAAPFAALDSFITVSFWQYGNPAFQPQNQTTFEGIDSLGRRVINLHLPWSDSNVYWDAGNSNSGSYDRINKLANTVDFSGQWNHWAFTKNCVTGSMKIYLNGHLWHSGTGLTRLMTGVNRFKIGSMGAGGLNYDGNIDEFAIFNKDLDSTTIQQWMFKDIDNTHPFYSNLLSYSKFNDAPANQAADSGPNGLNGTYFGAPEAPFVSAPTLFRNVEALTLRPEIVFEQGVFTSHLESIVVIDSTQNAPLVVVQYLDPSHPTTATDTIQVWQPYYSYSYNSNGSIADSVMIGPDGTFHLVNTPYHGAPFEVIKRYEIGRFITPYGINLDLGAGFTWVYDVTDYRTLLHDSVRLSAGNWQEQLDLQFIFIKGTPTRDILKIENVWNGNYGLSTFENTVLPKDVNLLPNASGFRLKTRTTGHGQGGATGCGEFCPKTHSVVVGGTTRYSWELWNECALNPLYPQGGTWVYDRAGWCPGMDVNTYDWELTPFVSPGATTNIDYNATSDPQGNYILETQLVTYGAPNFTLDASVEHIKSPSKADLYRRYNPICSNPIITIKNNGSTTLTSLKIKYGIRGSLLAEYNWTGSLKFLEEADVHLNSFWWTGVGNEFEVALSEPNGGQDQYADNNGMTSTFDVPPALPADLIFEMRSNNTLEDSYTIKDEAGNIVVQRAATATVTTYKDTVHLAPGCYEFRLLDSENDGLAFWANTAQGSGTMRIRNAVTGTQIKSFATDFGAEIFYHFRVGYNLEAGEIDANDYIQIYPNPSRGLVTVDIGSAAGAELKISVFNSLGEVIYQTNKSASFNSSTEIDLSQQPGGVYIVKVLAGAKCYTQRIVLTR